MINQSYRQWNRAWPIKTNDALEVGQAVNPNCQGGEQRQYPLAGEARALRLIFQGMDEQTQRLVGLERHDKMVARVRPQVRDVEVAVEDPLAGLLKDGRQRETEVQRLVAHEGSAKARYSRAKIDRRAQSE